jgi:hypothetical protein
MPPYKTRTIVRAICLLLVIYSLYYIRLERPPLTITLGYGRVGGPAVDILNSVNMFIGTKNGGERYSTDDGDDEYLTSDMSRSRVPRSVIALW